MTKQPALFKADATLLLRQLAPHITDSMLEEISAADYGNDKLDHFAVLRSLRDELFIPPAEWIPCEVLELVRWSRPDQEGWHPGAEGERGHWMRAFSCCALLLITGQHDIGRLVSANEAIGPMMESLLILGKDVWHELGSFLEWFANAAHSAGKTDEDAFLGVALLSAYCHAHVENELAASELVEWTLARELAEWSSEKDARWLFRTTTHKLNSESWDAILKDMLSGILTGRLDVELRESILNALER